MGPIGCFCSGFVSVPVVPAGTIEAFDLMGGFCSEVDSRPAAATEA